MFGLSSFHQHLVCRRSIDVWFVIDLLRPGNKKSVFSADISPKNRFSAGTEKKNKRKNRSEEKSGKNR